MVFSASSYVSATTMLADRRVTEAMPLLKSLYRCHLAVDRFASLRVDSVQGLQIRFVFYVVPSLDFVPLDSIVFDDCVGCESRRQVRSVDKPVPLGCDQFAVSPELNDGDDVRVKAVVDVVVLDIDS